jgi:uncharacterized protein
LLSATLVSACIDQVGQQIVPRYLTARDHGWLGLLLDEHEAHVGRRKLALDRRLGELFDAPSASSRSRTKLLLARRVLDQLARTRTEAVVSPKEARALTFRAAAGSGAPRERVLSEVAASLGVRRTQLGAALFADLPGERSVCSLGSPSPAAFAERVNAALVAALIARAVTVRIRASGHTRALVRHARAAGLICLARRAKEGELALELSGPASLFRRTTIYGRALAGVMPRLTGCDSFELRASCLLPRSDDAATLIVRSGGPGTAPPEMAPPDPRPDQRLARELHRLAPDWEVRADPAPIESAGVLLFPDYELIQGADPTRRWLVEIVGFWTPQYLTAKLERLRQAGIERLLLCVDTNKGCGDGELPRDARILEHRRRVDAERLLARIAGSSAGGGFTQPV